MGLDSGEIADVPGITKNNGSAMLNRLKKAVEESIRALVMLNPGDNTAEDLDAELAVQGIAGMSPEAGTVVCEHAALCGVCEGRVAMVTSAYAPELQAGSPPPHTASGRAAA